MLNRLALPISLKLGNAWTRLACTGLLLVVVTGVTQAQTDPAAVAADPAKDYEQTRYANTTPQKLIAIEFIGNATTRESTMLREIDIVPGLLLTGEAIEQARAGVEARHIHRHRCPRLQSRRRSVAEAARHPHRALRQPFGVGVASRPYSRH